MTLGLLSGIDGPMGHEKQKECAELIRSARTNLYDNNRGQDMLKEARSFKTSERCDPARQLHPD